MTDIVKEAGLGPNWQPIDVLPIRPGASGAPPLPNAMPAYFQGSISPQMQHDAVFVGTQYGSPCVPTVSLMPINASGIAVFNSGVFNAARSSGGGRPGGGTGGTGGGGAGGGGIIPSSDVQLWMVNGNPDLLSVGMINGIPA